MVPLGKTYLLPILSVLATLPAGVALTQAQTTDPYAAALHGADIGTSKEELSEYLLSLVPTEENEQHMAELVKQLGDESFLLREQAEVALSGMPNPPRELLQRAAQSDDPELRYRAKAILEKSRKGSAHGVTYAVYGYIVHHEIKGLTFPILQYMPHSAEPSAFGLASQAVQATATKDDLDLLRRAIKRKYAPRRAVAVLALAKLKGMDAIDELLPLLEHEDTVVRLATAQALANLGERASIPVLIELLASEDVETRTRSIAILRMFTHEHFQYAAYQGEAERTAAMERWNTWFAEHGADAELHFPLKPMQRFHNRTLISQYPKVLREIDAEGNELMRADGFQYAWGCHATADGIRVIADFSLKQLVEYDATGKEVLRLKDLPGPPADVRRLESGNFLLALAEANKVVEMDRKGNVLWSVEMQGRPTTANRLPNGNTLVNLQFAKRVVEIDPSGKVVWQLTGLSNALTAQALPNGNVLVCEMNQGLAVEFNRKGVAVWKQHGFHNACQAQRLPNGNTLVSDSDGLHEYNPDHERVWHLNVPRGRFWRY